MASPQTIFYWPLMDTFARDEALDKIAEALRADQVVVLPSETRYALVARADSEYALECLMTIKGRAANQPVAIFLPSREHISTIAQEIPLSIALAEKFLPGPMTLVLTPRKKFPEPIILNGSIGIRVSPEPILVSLFQRIDFPLTATSANRSGSPECTTVDEILAQFGDAALHTIDDGPRDGKTSTVIDARGEEIKILREGAIGRREVEAAIREM